MYVTAHPAAAEKRATDQRRDHSGRQAARVVGAADHLVDGRSARFGFALGRFRGERGRGAVVVGVDAFLIGAAPDRRRA